MLLKILGYSILIIVCAFLSALLVLGDFSNYELGFYGFLNDLVITFIWICVPIAIVIGIILGILDLGKDIKDSFIKRNN
jgi:hypothetical protein